MQQSFGREFFHSIAGDLWSSFRWVRDLEEHSPDVDPVALLEDDAELRELVARYAFSHDSKDEVWTTSLFMPDGIMGHRDGSGRQSEGRAAITERFKGFNAFHAFSRHRIANIVVRVLPGRAEAWMTAYFHAARNGHSGEVESQFGRYLGRFERNGDHWCFADWRASVDFVQLYGDHSAIPEPDNRLREPEFRTRSSRRFTLEGEVAPGGGRHSFEALSGDLWGAQQWLADLPVPVGSRTDLLQVLLDERRLNELISNYAYAADSHNGSWASSLFTDDALLLDGPYVVEGRNAAAHLASAGSENLRTLHRYSNILVRFVPGLPDAFVFAYVHVATAEGDERSARFGRVFARATIGEGCWRITEWCACDDAQLALQPSENIGRANNRNSANVR